MRQCNKCKEHKKLDKFTPSQLKNKTGWCKSCVSLRAAENYEKNAERIKLRVKIYVKNNKEKVKVQRAKYRKENKEKVNASIQVWIKNHREESNEIKTRWVKNNPEKRQESVNKWARNNQDKQNAQTAKRRAKLLHATPLCLTKKLWKQIDEFYKIAKELQWLCE